MGRRQVADYFRCLCILWVSLSDDFCECKLNLVKFSSDLTAA